jgi:hypothetical protein
MKRRKVLTIFSATAATTIFGASALLNWKQSIKYRLKNRYESLKVLEPAPTGELTPQTLKTLRATTAAILQDRPSGMSHYEDFFRWRAEHVQGYNQLYDTFAATLDKLTKKASNRAFIDVDVAQQRQILDQAISVHPSRLPYQLETLRVTLFEKDQWFFDEYIIRQIFQVYARTDALILVGYESWRSQPRGLENYRKPPNEVIATLTPSLNTQGK